MHIVRIRHVSNLFFEMIRIIAIELVVKQIKNSFGLYFCYIDDIFIAINWPLRHLLKQINRWNHFDENINLSTNISSSVNFLDLYIENRDSRLFTSVYQKPSYEPYYLPFNSIHPLHMKMNIPFTMLLRAIRYCSTFDGYLNEPEKLRIALLLNKYPNKLIDQQCNKVLSKFNINELLSIHNYDKIRTKTVNAPVKEKIPINYDKKNVCTFYILFECENIPKKIS